jgi:hypothetical protein
MDKNLYMYLFMEKQVDTDSKLRQGQEDMGRDRDRVRDK